MDPIIYNQGVGFSVRSSPLELSFKNLKHDNDMALLTWV